MTETREPVPYLEASSPTDANAASVASEHHPDENQLHAGWMREWRNFWLTPAFVLTLASGVAAILGAGFGAVSQGYFSTRLERQKFESAIIQQALQNPDKTEVAKYLLFLVDAGIVRSLNGRRISQLARTPEQLPTRPGNSADLKVNGLDGPVVMVDGEPLIYSWTSADATACQLFTSTGDKSGITVEGEGTFARDHPWYPAPGAISTLVFVCTDGISNASDAIVLLGAVPSR